MSSSKVHETPLCAGVRPSPAFMLCHAVSCCVVLCRAALFGSHTVLCLLAKLGGLPGTCSHAPRKAPVPSQVCACSLRRPMITGACVFDSLRVSTHACTVTLWHTYTTKTARSSRPPGVHIATVRIHIATVRMRMTFRHFALLSGAFSAYARLLSAGFRQVLASQERFLCLCTHGTYHCQQGVVLCLCVPLSAPYYSSLMEPSSPADLSAAVLVLDRPGKCCSTRGATFERAGDAALLLGAGTACCATLYRARCFTLRCSLASVGSVLCRVLQCAAVCFTVCVMFRTMYYVWVGVDLTPQPGLSLVLQVFWVGYTDKGLHLGCLWGVFLVCLSFVLLELFRVCQLQLLAVPGW